MSTSNPLTPFARRPGGIFADVDHVDECGAPVLAADARDLGICENEMPGDTPVRVNGCPGAKTEGFLTTVRLAIAQRDVERGLLVRTGARTFQVKSLAPSIGPGLTGAQKRRKHLAEVAS